MASRSLGTLTLDLVAKVGGFTAGMSQAERQANKSLKGIERDARQTAQVLGAAFAATTLTALKSWVTQAGDAANEITNLSRVAGLSAKDFQTMSYAAGTVGISQEKLADQLKDVQDRIGDFATTGGGPLKDFFDTFGKQAGITIQQLQKLSGPEALQLIVKTMQDAGASGKDMTFMLESVASDATALLPLLKDNGAEFQRLQERAEQLGTVLDDNTVAAAKQMHQSLEDIGKVSDSVKTKIGASLAPTFNQLADAFADTARDGNLAVATSDALRTVLVGTLYAGTAIVGTFQQIGSAIGGLAAAGVAAATGEFRQAASIIKDIDTQTEAIGAKTAKTLADIKASWSAPLKLPPIQAPDTARQGGSGKTQAEIKAEADAAAKAAAAAAKANAAAMVAEAKRLSTLKETGAELDDQLANINAQDGKTKELGQNAQALLKWQREIAEIQAKADSGKQLTAEQAVLLAQKDELSALYAQNAEREKAVDLAKRQKEEARALADFQANINASLKNAQRDSDDALAGLTLGDQARSRLQELSQVRAKYQDQLDGLLTSRNQNQITQEIYDKEVAIVRDAQEKEIAIHQNKFAKLDEAQADWTNGALSAWNDYAENAKNVSGQVKNVAATALRGTTDAIVNFVKTGKLSFKELADSIVEQLIRIQIQQAAVSIFSKYFGGGDAGGGITSTGVSTSPGGRASGGPVAPGSMYEVNEKGPELLSQGGKDFLMMGGSGGFIRPLSGAQRFNDEGGGGSATVGGVVQHITVGGGADEATIQRINNAAKQGAEQGYKMVLRDFRGNGPARQLLRR